MPRADSRLGGSSLASAIMIATGGTIITATDIMIAAVTGEDPHERSRPDDRWRSSHPPRSSRGPGVGNPATWRTFDTVFADDEEHVEGKLTFPRELSRALATGMPRAALGLLFGLATVSLQIGRVVRHAKVLPGSS